MSDSEKNKSSIDKTPVSFSLYVGNDQVQIDPSVAWLRPHKHFSMNALPSKLKRVAGIPESKEINIYRYSRSSNSYVLLNDEAGYNAMFRAIKVKKHLSFCVWDASLRKPVASIGLKPKAAPVPPTTESKQIVEDEVANIVLSFLSSDKGKQAIDEAISKKMKDINSSIDDSVSDISERLNKQLAINVAQEVEKQSKSKTSTTINVSIPPPEDQSSSAESPPEDQSSSAKSPTAEVTDAAVDEPQQENDTMANDEADSEPEISYYHSATCDNCNRWIKQYRYKCLWCTDYDLCSSCMMNDSVDHSKSHSFVKIRFREDIVRRHESAPSSHEGILCDGPCCVSNRNFITGDRYTCLTCDNFDLCGKCANLDSWKHDPSHRMALRSSATSCPQILPSCDRESENRQLIYELKYVARLNAFDYKFDNAHGKMSWNFSNVGYGAWPAGTIFAPIVPEGVENLATPILLTSEVAVGKGVRFTSTFPLPSSSGYPKCDYSSWVFKAPDGTEFSESKNYYHGMKVDLLHVLANQKLPKQEEEKPLKSASQEPASQGLQLETNEEKAEQPGSETSTGSCLFETLTPRASSSPFESELENSAVKLFTIPTTSQENIQGDDMLPDGSQISLSASIHPCMSPPNPCIPTNPEIAGNNSSSEADMLSETDDTDDVADDYDVVNTSELSDEEA